MNKKTKQNKSIFYLAFVVTIAVFSYGFWWGQEKKENPPEQETLQKKSEREVRITPAPVTRKISSDEIQKKPVSSVDQFAKAAKNNKPKRSLEKLDQTTPKKREEDIEKVQSELKQIVSRTQELSVQSRGDRAEIQRILDRAKIHEQILRNIVLPKPLMMNQQLNVDEIARREKLRLIAEEATRAQQQLRTLETIRTTEQVMRTQKILGGGSLGGSASSEDVSVHPQNVPESSAASRNSEKS